MVYRLNSDGKIAVFIGNPHRLDLLSNNMAVFVDKSNTPITSGRLR
jgi:hypothetical protein